MTRFTVTIQCFRTDGGIVVGGEDVDGLDDNVGHWLVKGEGAGKLDELLYLLVFFIPGVV